MPPQFAPPPPASERAEPLSVTVRPAEPKDIPTILGFIRDLAEYEEALDKAQATPELMQKNLFDDGHVASALIAEQTEDGKPVGVAVYYFSFSTWTGKPSLYLEDLYVSPSSRNRGAGKALFRALGAVAEEKGCPRMDWSVLTWNKPSIAFYTQVLGADKMEEWRTCRLEAEGIKKLRTLGA